MSEETKKTPRSISRREFLRDAGIVVGGTAVSSAFFLSACGKEVEVTKTVTTTAPGSTSTVTTTAPGAPGATVTAPGSTQTVTKYTCPVDGLEFDSLDALKAHYDAVHDKSDGNENIVNLTVNGAKYNLQVEPNWDLQYVLHDVLGLIDVKTFCYRGACGSCTVIVNGRPILACMKIASHCDGAIIETAQGIVDSNPVLTNAYIKHHTMQCGYCTPGFVTTVKALLDRNSSPTSEEIVEAIAGNMCRCGTYPAHVKATLEIAETMKGGV